MAHTSELPPSVSLRQTEVTSDQIPSEYCTCGTRLIEHARFCHMCGKPAFELTAEPVIEVTPPPLPQNRGPVRFDQMPVSFRNPLALRVAFLMSLGILLMMTLPVINLLSPLWWLGAGLGATMFYSRLTGAAVSTKAGARLGSLTGVLASVSMLVMITINLALSGSNPYQQMLQQSPEAAKMLKDTPQSVVAICFVLVILIGIAILSALVVGTCAAGGALGARFANRNAKA